MEGPKTVADGGGSGEAPAPNPGCVIAHFVVALVLFALSAKNLPFVLFVVTILAMIATDLTGAIKYKLIGYLLLAMILLTGASIFSPIDVSVQYGPELDLKMNPAVYALGSNGAAAELYNRGMMPGRDFVIYRRMSAFNEVRQVLTLIIPGRDMAMERLRDHLEQRGKFVEQCEKERSNTHGP